MVTRVYVRNIYQELYRSCNDLQKIYSKLPMDDSSSQKVNELYLIVNTTLAPIINEIPQDSDEDTLSKWLIEETRARHALAHVKIYRLYQLLSSEQFTEEEKALISTYFAHISKLWRKLETHLPLNEFYPPPEILGWFARDIHVAWI
jgi:hypothetical protein